MAADSENSVYQIKVTLEGVRPAIWRRLLVPASIALEGLHDVLHYEYDFGDSWVHKVVLEKVLPNAESQDTLSCIAGERACPPEDSGGAWRYAELLRALSDRSNIEHAEMLEWIGDDFDPERFDLAEVNKILGAGTVAAVDEQVSRFKEGDRVYVAAALANPKGGVLRGVRRGEGR